MYIIYYNIALMFASLKSQTAIYWMDLFFFLGRFKCNIYSKK